MSSDDLLRRAIQPTLGRLRELAGRTPPAVQVLLQKIGDHYCDSACLVFVIQRQSVTTDWQVKEVFRRELGLTPKGLIRECRRETSSLLLRDTSLTVAKISRLVGYKGARGFETLYSALTGLTPSKMRDCLRLVHPDRRPVGDEVLSWYYRVRHHRGELRAADYRAALAYLRDRFRPL